MRLLVFGSLLRLIIEFKLFIKSVFVNLMSSLPGDDPCFHHIPIEDSLHDHLHLNDLADLHLHHLRHKVHSFWREIWVDIRRLHHSFTPLVYCKFLFA